MTAPTTPGVHVPTPAAPARPSRGGAVVATVPMPRRWHRPLLVVAAAMAVLTAVTAVLAVVDPQVITGQNAWFKPMKFAVSIALYCVSIAWMLGQLRRWQRVGQVVGTVTAVALVIEIVIIVGAAAAGTTSHFNVATTLSTTLWAVMGGSIALVWVAGLVLAVVLAVNPMPDAARTLAVRAGVFLGLVGMAVAFFMTSPTSEQLDDFQGVAGAHAVGVPDGGPGLPFLGWSTEGGDLRAPHFVGLHALQLIPLVALGLELLASRVPALREGRTRFGLVAIVSATYAAAIGLLTVQALAGEPVVAPSPVTLVAVGVLAVAALGATALVLRAGRRRRRMMVS